LDLFKRIYSTLIDDLSAKETILEHKIRISERIKNKFRGLYTNIKGLGNLGSTKMRNLYGKLKGFGSRLTSRFRTKRGGKKRTMRYNKIGKSIGGDDPFISLILGLGIVVGIPALTIYLIVCCCTGVGCAICGPILAGLYGPLVLGGLVDFTHSIYKDYRRYMNSRARNRGPVPVPVPEEPVPVPAPVPEVPVPVPELPVPVPELPVPVPEAPAHAPEEQYNGKSWEESARSAWKNNPVFGKFGRHWQGGKSKRKRRNQKRSKKN